MVEREKRSRFNSSIIRVRPIFQRLISRDTTGQSWLPSVLKLAACNQPYAWNLAKDMGTLLEWVVARRSFVDEVLKSRGISKINLEECFEHPLPPSADFLHWLIGNPDRMVWPNNGRARFGNTTQRFREELFGQRGTEDADWAKREATIELSRLGPNNSKRRWWAFEGFTSADCYFETDKLVLLIEGKRFENVSSAVQWYPNRNQLVRNMEATYQAAAGKRFAVLAVGEGAIEEVDLDTLTASLPHLTTNQRDELWSHYLGSTTWMAVCQATGVDYAQLPNTVDDAMDELRKFGNLTL